MIIEPKWSKKIECQIPKKINEFFLTVLGSQNKKGFYEVDGLAKGVLVFPFCGVIRRVGEQSGEIRRQEKQNCFFLTPKWGPKAFQSLLTLSFSFAKLKYPLSWKTIFVYLFQKKKIG